MTETVLVNKQPTWKSYRHIFYLCVNVLICISIRWLLVYYKKVPFNSDEAIVGLMASHILRGENPIFFYGQAYMGSLDSYIVAGFFRIFGESVTALRLSQTVLFVVFIYLTHLYSKVLLLSRKAADIVVTALCFSPVFFMLYTTVSLGGYIESLIIGIATLLLGYKLELSFGEQNGHQQKSSVAISFGLGFCIGVGFWVLGLTLVFSFTAIIFLLYSVIVKKVNIKKIILILITFSTGLIVGLFPIWIFIISKNGAVLLQELAGSAIAANQVPYISQIGLHLINLLIFGFTVILGFRPPWGVTWLILPLIPVIFLVWAVIITRSFKLYKSNTQFTMLRIWLPGFLLFTAFIFTPFGIDPSGRYFLPVYVSLAITIGFWIVNENGKLKRVAIFSLLLVCLYNTAGILQAAVQSPNGITTQFAPDTSINHEYDRELINFLIGSNNTRGYSTYWVAYPINFLSKEEVILIPALPYHSDLRHTVRDNRYPPYTKEVDRSKDPVYITANNPRLDLYLSRAFNSLAVTWREKRIGDYLVYYDMSRKVEPDEIGMGINRP